jgi:hypothetical protein
MHVRGRLLLSAESRRAALRKCHYIHACMHAYIRIYIFLCIYFCVCLYVCMHAVTYVV